MRRVPRWLPLLAALGAFAAFAAAGGLDAVTADNIVARYDELRVAVDADRTLAAVLFVGATAALASLVLFPAIFVMWVAGGLLFGIGLGTLLSIVGSTLGGLVSFLVVRAAFADRLGAWMGERGRRFRAALERDGTAFLLILRASPLPFWIVTLAAAASGLRPRQFVAATAAGLVPPCLIWANVGSGLADALAAGDRPSLAMMGDPRVLWPLTLLSAFGVISVALRQWSQRRAGREAR